MRFPIPRLVGSAIQYSFRSGSFGLRFQAIKYNNNQNNKNGFCQLGQSDLFWFSKEDGSVARSESVPFTYKFPVPTTEMGLLVASGNSTVEIDSVEEAHRKRFRYLFREEAKGTVYV